MINFYISICLSELVPDPLTRYMVAYMLIGYNCFAIGTNLVIVLGSVMIDAFRNLVKKCTKDKQNKRKKVYQ